MLQYKVAMPYGRRNVERVQTCSATTHQKRHWVFHHKGIRAAKLELLDDIGKRAPQDRRTDKGDNGDPDHYQKGEDITRIHVSKGQD